MDAVERALRGRWKDLDLGICKTPLDETSRAPDVRGLSIHLRG
jgi:hypothetical protein